MEHHSGMHGSSSSPSSSSSPHSQRFSFQGGHAQQQLQPLPLPEAAAWVNRNNNGAGNRWILQQQQQQQPQPQQQQMMHSTTASVVPRSPYQRQQQHQQQQSVDSQTFVWTRIFPTSNGGVTIQPPPRSGAASVVVCGRLYIFGGYGGGTGRLDDFYCFHFQSQTWEVVQVLSEEKPGCRENNGVVIADDASKCIFLFGGYDGQAWLNDLWKFDIEAKRWTCLQESTFHNAMGDTTNNDASLESTRIMVHNRAANAAAGADDFGAVVGIQGRVPSRRFGYVSVVHEGRFIVWGGFDGSRWLNDMYVYTFSTRTWAQIEQPTLSDGSMQQVVWPSVRSCPAWAKDGRYVYIQGGYDGVERKSDFFALDLATYTWKEMPSWGAPPSPRYFHSCGIHGSKLYLYGGYSGSERLADLYAYDLETQHWSRIDARGGDVPSGRSSLVLQVHESHLYVFGGYNGSTVLNDFYQFRLKPINLPPTCLVHDLSKLIQNPDLADVVFLVEGKLVYANRAILAIRSAYFRVLLYGGMRESSTLDTAEVGLDCRTGESKKMPGLTGDKILLPDVSYEVFLKVLEYIYTDTLSGELSLDFGILLLIASELFMLDRLKALCEDLIRHDIHVDNVTEILVAAHRHNANGLKDLALEFILLHLNDPIVMDGLSDLKSEPDLLLEIIKRNSLTLQSPIDQHHSRPGGFALISNGSRLGNNPNVVATTTASNAAGASVQHHDVYYLPTATDGRLLIPHWNNNNNNNGGVGGPGNINYNNQDERYHLAGGGGGGMHQQQQQQEQQQHRHQLGGGGLADS